MWGGNGWSGPPPMGGGGPGGWPQQQRPRGNHSARGMGPNPPPLHHARGRNIRPTMMVPRRPPMMQPPLLPQQQQRVIMQQQQQQQQWPQPQPRGGGRIMSPPPTLWQHQQPRRAASPPPLPMMMMMQQQQPPPPQLRQRSMSPPPVRRMLSPPPPQPYQQPQRTPSPQQIFQQRRREAARLPPAVLEYSPRTPPMRSIPQPQQHEFVATRFERPSSRWERDLRASGMKGPPPRRSRPPPAEYYNNDEGYDWAMEAMAHRGIGKNNNNNINNSSRGTAYGTGGGANYNSYNNNNNHNNGSGGGGGGRGGGLFNADGTRSSAFGGSSQQQDEGFMRLVVDATVEQACQLLQGQPHGTYLVHRDPMGEPGIAGFDGVLVSVVMHDEVLSNHGYICQPEEFRPGGLMHNRWRRYNGWLTISEQPWQDNPEDLNSSGGLFRDALHMSKVFPFLHTPCATEGIPPPPTTTLPRTESPPEAFFHQRGHHNINRNDGSSTERVYPEDDIRHMPQYAERAGIGLDLDRMEDGNFVVKALFPGSSAEQCKIVLPGDIILRINGQAVNTLDDASIKRQVVGRPGSAVILTCKRNDSRGGPPVLFEATLMRGTFKNVF